MGERKFQCVASFIQISFEACKRPFIFETKRQQFTVAFTTTIACRQFEVCYNFEWF
tara:strand:- start:1319 stop:1486 length:168 start_codon:yes stop_codon:yes gene_type:complete